MEEDAGEYGHPYPRVDKYGKPVPPVDMYGNPIPREPGTVGLGGVTGDAAAAPTGEYGTGAAYPHEGVTAPLGGAAPAYQGGGGVGPGETALAYEGMVGGGGGIGSAATAGMGASQLQPTREEEHTSTTRSGSSSSSSSSEDDGQGGRRKKKSIKEKIKEKLPGSHKREKQAVPAAAGGTTGTHEKKGIMDKIKEKLPGHH